MRGSVIPLRFDSILPDLLIDLRWNAASVWESFDPPVLPEVETANTCFLSLMFSKLFSPCWESVCF